MKNKGITLVAMVVTVLIMLILAGVSVSFIAGNNNSAITEAEKAVYKNSITQIEQKINEFYLDNFNDMPELRNKAISLILYFEMDKYADTSQYKKNWVDTAKASDTIFHKENEFYKNIKDYTDENQYILTDQYQFWSNSETSMFELSWEKSSEYNGEEKNFYLLNTVNLKKMFESDVKVLDLLSNYDALNGVYAITADLRVFYIENGLNNVIGIDPAEIPVTDNNRIVFEAGSDIANTLNSGKEMTIQQVKVHKKVSIDSNSTITSLKEIGKLSSMQELIIDNKEIISLQGIEGADSLKILRLYGNNIESFEGIEKCINLEKIYLHNFSNEQFAALCTAMKNTNYTKLKVFAAVGYWHDHYTENYVDERYVIPKVYASGIVENKNLKLTDISPLGNLTSKTRASIDTFLLNSNAITDASVLSKFPNLIRIKMESNDLTTLNGIVNHSKLEYLRVAGNKLAPDALDALKNPSTGSATLPQLTDLDLRGNFELKNVNALSTCTKLVKLYFKSDTSFNRSDNDVKLDSNQVREIKDFLNALGSGLQIDSKYSLALLSDDTTRIEIKDVSMGIEEFQNLAYSNKIIYLAISNLKLLNESGAEITSADEYTSIITETLSNLIRVRYLQLYNLPNLNSVNFVTNMKTLVELDVRKCNNVLDFTCLNNSDMGVTKLAIDNVNIDLTQIQPAINKLGEAVYKVDENGDIVYSNGEPLTDAKYYWSKGYGLVLCDNDLYLQLKNCTNLTRLWMHRSWEGDNVVIAAKGLKSSKAIEIDLSNLTKLEYFYSYAIYCKYILPENVIYASYSFVQDPSYGSKMDLSKCKKIKEINTRVPNAKSVIVSALNTVPADNNVEILSLNQQNNLLDLNFLSRFKKLKILDMNSNYQQIMKLTDISALSNATSLEEFHLSYAPNIKELPSLANLTELTTISITNSGLESIIDSVSLRKLTNLSRLDFSFNSIVKIDALIPNEENEFTNLEYLNLQNNCLENNPKYDDYTTLGYNITNDIFVPLNNRKLRYLYVENNPNYTDTAALKSLTWIEKTGF